MSNQYLIDTNILIYYFNGEPVVKPIIDEILTGKVGGWYCPISWIELLCYPSLTEEQGNEMREFLKLLNSVS
ncbi:MAG: hypothetical protein RLZZ338_2351 [Cyanobacteriota bacterium]|jgi:predicted nucleic acid-binding protein